MGLYELQRLLGTWLSGGGISTEEKLGVMSEEYEIPVVNEFVKDIARVREILEPLQKDEDLVK